MYYFSKMDSTQSNGSGLNAADSSYSFVESVDDRVVCLVRLLLSVSALIIIFIDPTSPDRFADVTYAGLIGYCLYSAVLYLLSLKTSTALPFTGYAHWIDVACYLTFIALSHGTNSIFLFFFFFSIIIAAFRSGFNEGFLVCVVSALSFSIIGYFMSTHGQELELNRFLIRPVYLLILGYMISFWGGQEIKFKRHLLLLKDVNRLSNPRFGASRTLSDILNRLRTFYEAESCMLVFVDSSGDKYSWLESTRGNPLNNSEIEQSGVASPLFNLPGKLAIFYRNNSYFNKIRAYDTTTGDEVKIAANIPTALADLLEAKSFFTVPVIKSGEMIGRLYITSGQIDIERSEIEFVSQLMEQILTVVENVELLNKLALGAVQQQRQKISRDIHDSTIQPYIGLKLGLEAIEIKYSAGADVGKDIEKLVRLTDSTIADLRGFVKNLQGETAEIEGSTLVLAVRKQAAKFQEFYDVYMTVEASDEFYLNDRLAAEAFQIVSEGLSNIKRHTKAKHGKIRIYQDENKLYLEIENDNAGTASETEKFVPKSITGRAVSLGGSALVERLDGRTKVLVEIPL